MTRDTEIEVAFAEGVLVLTITEKSAMTNERRWRIELDNGRLHIRAYDDVGSYFSALHVEREGADLHVTS